MKHNILVFAVLLLALPAAVHATDAAAKRKKRS